MSFIRCYLQVQSEDKDELGQLAIYVHKRLQKTINVNGARKEPPSQIEFDNVKVRLWKKY
jgi:hypothetical protein